MDITFHPRFWSGGVCHPAGSAARTETPTLATEGDKQISAAVVAMESQKAVCEDAAHEVLAERLLDVARQTARRILWRGKNKSEPEESGGDGQE